MLLNFVYLFKYLGIIKEGVPSSTTVEEEIVQQNKTNLTKHNHKGS